MAGVTDTGSPLAQFTMAQSQREAFADLFWGVGVTAVVIALAAAVFTIVNGCRRIQALHCCKARHVGLWWWTEVGLRFLVGGAAVLFLVW